MYGFHIRTKNETPEDIIKNIKELKKNDCKLIQIFREDFDDYINTINECDLNIILHSSFNINISQTFAPFSYATRLAMEEIKLCLLNNISTYVLHCGVLVRKYDMTLGEAQNNMFKLLYYISKKLKLYKNNSFTICIELLAGGINDMLYDIIDFSKFYKRLRLNNYTRKIKICLDTCHIFASGYDIRTINETKKYLKGVDDCIGINNIKLIHLNDSVYELDSRKDKHAEIGKGEIGSESLKYIFKYFNKRKTNIIFECPGSIKDNLIQVL